MLVFLLFGLVRSRRQDSINCMTLFSQCSLDFLLILKRQIAPVSYHSSTVATVVADGMCASGGQVVPKLEWLGRSSMGSVHDAMCL